MIPMRPYWNQFAWLQGLVSCMLFVYYFPQLRIGCFKWLNNDKKVGYQPWLWSRVHSGHQKRAPGRIALWLGRVLHWVRRRILLPKSVWIYPRKPSVANQVAIKLHENVLKMIRNRVWRASRAATAKDLRANDLMHVISRPAKPWKLEASVPWCKGSITYEMKAKWEGTYHL